MARKLSFAEICQIDEIICDYRSGKFGFFSAVKRIMNLTGSSCSFASQLVCATNKFAR